MKGKKGRVRKSDDDRKELLTMREGARKWGELMIERKRGGERRWTYSDNGKEEK